MRSEVEKIRRRSCPEKLGSGAHDSWFPKMGPTCEGKLEIKLR